jgi:hypothetical protein
VRKRRKIREKGGHCRITYLAEDFENQVEKLSLGIPKQKRLEETPSGHAEEA